MSWRRVIGFLVMATIWSGALLLIVDGGARVPGPFFLVLVAGGVAAWTALWFAHVVRGRIDPDFDPPPFRRP